MSRYKYRQVIILCLIFSFFTVACYGKLKNNAEKPQQVSPPHIVNVVPQDQAQEVGKDTVIEVVFDSDMDITSVEENFKIVPALPGDFFWEGNTLNFKPHKDLIVSNIPYKITISKQARNTAGLTLEQDYTWQFTTANLTEDQPDLAVSLPPAVTNLKVTPLATLGTTGYWEHSGSRIFAGIVGRTGGQGNNLIMLASNQHGTDSDEWWIWNGNQYFLQASATYTKTSRTMSSGDIEGNGKIEYFGFNDDLHENMFIFEQENASVIPTWKGHIDDTWWSSVIADVNRDGRDELVFGGKIGSKRNTTGQGYVSVWQWDGKATKADNDYLQKVWQYTDFSEPVWSVAAGDIDGDGLKEIITCNGKDGTKIFKQNGDGYQNIWNDPIRSGRIEVADLDGSGKPKIIRIDEKGKDIFVYKWQSNKGLILLWRTYNRQEGIYKDFAWVGDINNDKKNEVLLNLNATGHYVVLEETSGLYKLKDYTGIFDGNMFLGGGDTDGDGQIELVLASPNKGGVHIVRLNQVQQ